jgi:hypothetical protein
MTNFTGRGSPDKTTAFQWQCMSLTLALFIGLRHEVGGDWFSYAESLEYFASLDFLTAITETQKSDPAFTLLCWLSPNLGGDHFVNLICGAIFSMGLVAFCRDQPNPWLALTIAVPYLVTVVAMGYTRQGVAIGLTMFGLVALGRENRLGFILWVGTASAFHKSAVILIPLALFSGSKRKWSSLVGVATIGSLAFTLFLQESVERLFAGYINDGMESSGAFVRVTMNAFPAGLFLVFRNRFALNEASRKFWTWMSISALLFIPILGISPSSTAVDRVALYWIPVQLFVLSRLPIALSAGPLSARLILRLTVVYSFSVLLIWLIFGRFSYLWIPYKFYPFEMIKNNISF